MKKNKTNRAGSAAGLSQYPWQNGGKRKMPKGVGAPIGRCSFEIYHNPYYTPGIGGSQYGR